MLGYETTRAHGRAEQRIADALIDAAANGSDPGQAIFDALADWRLSVSNGLQVARDATRLDFFELAFGEWQAWQAFVQEYRDSVTPDQARTFDIFIRFDTSVATAAAYDIGLKVLAGCVGPGVPRSALRDVLRLATPVVLAALPIDQANDPSQRQLPTGDGLARACLDVELLTFEHAPPSPATATTTSPHERARQLLGRARQHDRSHSATSSATPRRPHRPTGQRHQHHRQLRGQHHPGRRRHAPLRADRRPRHRRQRRRPRLVLRPADGRRGGTGAAQPAGPPPERCRPSATSSAQSARAAPSCSASALPGTTSPARRSPSPTTRTAPSRRRPRPTRTARLSLTYGAPATAQIELVDGDDHGGRPSRAATPSSSPPSRPPAAGVTRLRNRAAVAAGCLDGPALDVLVSAPGASTFDENLVVLLERRARTALPRVSSARHWLAGKVTEVELRGLADVAPGTHPSGFATGAGRYEIEFTVDQPRRITIVGTLSACSAAGTAELLLVSFDTGVVVRRTCVNPGVHGRSQPRPLRLHHRGRRRDVGRQRTADRDVRVRRQGVVLLVTRRALTPRGCGAAERSASAAPYGYAADKPKSPLDVSTIAPAAGEARRARDHQGTRLRRARTSR